MIQHKAQVDVGLAVRAADLDGVLLKQLNRIGLELLKLFLEIELVAALGPPDAQRVLNKPVLPGKGREAVRQFLDAGWLVGRIQP